MQNYVSSLGKLILMDNMTLKLHLQNIHVGLLMQIQMISQVFFFLFFF